MNSRFLTTRRHVLQQLATAFCVAAVTLPAQAAQRRLSVCTAPDLSAAIDSLITHPNSAAIIGKAYVTQFEDEKSAEVLERELIAELQEKKQRIDEHALLSMIRSDFEVGDIVNLHGWLLSRTEARLCAIYAFRSQPLIGAA